MKTDLFRILQIGFLASILMGCSQIAPETPLETATHPSAETAAVTETPLHGQTQNGELPKDPALPIPSVGGLPALIEKAKADLSHRLAIPASEINTLETREVFWPDASLGCPQSGAVYDQIQVPGYLIKLQANGTEFEYHANIHNQVLYCENPTPPILETLAPTPP